MLGLADMKSNKLSYVLFQVGTFQQKFNQSLAA